MGPRETGPGQLCPSLVGLWPSEVEASPRQLACLQGPHKSALQLPGPGRAHAEASLRAAFSWSGLSLSLPCPHCLLEQGEAKSESCLRWRALGRAGDAQCEGPPTACPNFPGPPGRAAAPTGHEPGTVRRLPLSCAPFVSSLSYAFSSSSFSFCSSCGSQSCKGDTEFQELLAYRGLTGCCAYRLVQATTVTTDPSSVSHGQQLAW